MMKREQILCDRCVRDILPADAKGKIEIQVTEYDADGIGSCVIWYHDYDNLDARCKKTLLGELDVFIAGYLKKRKKLLGGDAPDPSE